MTVYEHLTIEQYNDLIDTLKEDAIRISTEITDTPKHYNWTVIELNIYSKAFICYSKLANAFWIDRHDTFITFSFWIDFSYY